MFKEVGIKLIETNKDRKNNRNITKRTSLEEKLELIKPSKKAKTTKIRMGQYYCIMDAIQTIFPEINCKIYSTQHANLNSRNY